MRPSTSLIATSFFAQIPKAERDALEALGIRRSFPRGTVLMFEHEPAERVMIILSGRVKVFRLGEDGHEILLSIRDPGDVIGELGSLDREPRVATVTALDPVEALVIPAEAFRARLETTPRLEVVLLEVISRRLRETTVKRSQSAESDTMGRVAARIIELADRYGVLADGVVSVDMPITHDELAAWAGASRAGVAHALQAMRELGWIGTKRHYLEIRNARALRARAAKGLLE